MKKHFQIYTTFEKKKMKKKKNKKNRRSFPKRNLIIEEIIKASVDLMKMIIYDFLIILMKWILYN